MDRRLRRWRESTGLASGPMRGRAAPDLRAVNQQVDPALSSCHQFLEPCLLPVRLTDSVVGGYTVRTQEDPVECPSLERRLGQWPDPSLSGRSVPPRYCKSIRSAVASSESAVMPVVTTNNGPACRSSRASASVVMLVSRSTVSPVRTCAAAQTAMARFASKASPSRWRNGASG